MVLRIAPSPSHDPILIDPIREETCRFGTTELHTAGDVDATLDRGGISLVYVDSVCGCAASTTRPGLHLLSLQGGIPEHVACLLAGVDHDAHDRLRERLPDLSGCAPQVILIRDGEPTRIWRRTELVKIDLNEFSRSVLEALGRVERRKNHRRIAKGISRVRGWWSPRLRRTS